MFSSLEKVYTNALVSIINEKLMIKIYISKTKKLTFLRKINIYRYFFL